jgi:hypothetical protein
MPGIERTVFWLTTAKKPTIQLSISCFFPTFPILCIRAALGPHAGVVNATKKGRASNALTSLAGHTGHPRYGWRCPGH